MENAIGKSMRERNESTKADKVIRREVTAVYTAGTLVDAGLLTSDMSTYCMSIKVYIHCCNHIDICWLDFCFSHPEFRNIALLRPLLLNLVYALRIQQPRNSTLYTLKTIKTAQSSRRLFYKSDHENLLWKRYARLSFSFIRLLIILLFAKGTSKSKIDAYSKKLPQWSTLEPHGAWRRVLGSPENWRRDQD